MRLFAILLGFLAVTTANIIQKLVQNEWTNFKLKYNKQYTNDSEDKHHFRAYVMNRNRIEEHNQQYYLNLTGFYQKENFYSDYYDSEFNTNMLGSIGASFIAPANTRIPIRMDWRKLGAVTPVKDQKSCACCWAFSATGALEGQHFLKTKTLVSLSEQNLVDCTYDLGNDGCEGGNIERAFEYVAKNRGIDTARSYPYCAEPNNCTFKRKAVGELSVGFTELNADDEDMLKVAVATKGPIAANIRGDLNSFHHYSRGIYDDPKCHRKPLNHYVLVVGYGTARDGRDYWILKNSWGTSWGAKGYMYLARNKNNTCGIASKATYPLV